jgi:hypothetical protein
MCSQGQRQASAEIEVAPEMVRAGIEAWLDHRNDEDIEFLVTEVFLAMFRRFREAAPRHQRGCRLDD